MRVAVAGLGLVSAHGALDATWRALVEGRSGLAPIRRFRADPLGDGEAAEVGVLDEGQRSRDRKREKLMSPAARFAVAAAREALAARGALGLLTDDTRAGVFLGVGLAGGEVEDVAGLLEASIVDGRIDAARLGGDGLARVHPLLSFQVLANMPVCHVAMEVGARGEGQARLSSGVETLAAIGEAARAVAEGRLDVALAGGADAPVNVVTYAQLVGAGRVGRSRPWAGPLGRGRDGARLGEGAAVMALGRGVTEVVVAGAAAEATVEEAIASALDEARLAPAAIGAAWLGCDGGRGDLDEAQAAARRLPRAGWVLPKAILGEALAAGPALSAVLAARALALGELPSLPSWIALEASPASPGATGAAVVLAVDAGGAACLVLVGGRS